MSIMAEDLGEGRSSRKLSEDGSLWNLLPWIELELELVPPPGVKIVVDWNSMFPALGKFTRVTTEPWINFLGLFFLMVGFW